MSPPTREYDDAGSGSTDWSDVEKMVDELVELKPEPEPEVPSSTDEVLEAVRKAAKARARCEERTVAALQEAVRTARAAGKSLREIAAEADVSYDTISRWTK